MGGEFESVNGRPTMAFSHLTRAGDGVGGCSGMIMNCLIVQPGAFPCISIISAYNLTFLRNTLSPRGAAAACIEGAANCGSIFARQNQNPNSAVPIFNSYASGNHDDGLVPIRTTGATKYTLTGGEVNALLQTTSAAAVAITVPPNSTTSLPIGTRIIIEQNGAGPVTLHPGRGVTLDGALTTSGQYQTLTLLKTTTNRWLITR
jgi:hypothetical protein